MPTPITKPTMLMRGRPSANPRAYLPVFSEKRSATINSVFSLKIAPLRRRWLLVGSRVLAPPREAQLRSAPRRSVLSKKTPRRSALPKETPYRVALSRLTPRRPASCRSAQLRSASRKSASERLAPRRSAQLSKFRAGQLRANRPWRDWPRTGSLRKPWLDSG
jgi:hypothetical protein